MSTIADLDLGLNSLTGTLPHEWDQLFALVSLRLNLNFLSGPLPSAWKRLDLEMLDLSHNSFTAFQDVLPVMGSSLRHLSIVNNPLSGTIPPFVGAVSQLQVLDISSNLLFGSIPDMYAPKLHTLHLNGNQLNGTMPSWLSTSPLQSIHLGNNFLHGDILSSLCRTRVCADVDLSNNQFGGSIPSVLFQESQRSIRRIRLQGNAISGTIPSSIGTNLLRLQHLDLSSNRLVGTLPFDSLANTMAVFDVSNNAGLTGELPLAVWKLPDLRMLFLAGTGLRGYIPFPFVETDFSTTDYNGSLVSCPTIKLVQPFPILSLSERFLDYKPCECLPGDYGKHGRCHSPCPQGADCTDGRVLSATAGHWCDSTRYAAGEKIGTCVKCFPGYCCTRATCEVAGDLQCYGDRQGTLCGECRPGFSAAVASRACLPDAECHAMAWVVPLLLAMTCVFAGVQFKLYKPQTTTGPGVISKIRSVVLHFYQVAPFVAGALPSYSRNPITTFFATVANIDVEEFTADGDGDGGKGICLVPGMSTQAKIAMSYSLPLFVIGWLTVFALGLWVAGKLQKYLQHVIKLALVTLGLGYSTLSKTTFTLLSCVQLEDGRNVLLANGEVECLQDWQKALFVLVILVCLYPGMLWVWIRNKYHSGDTSLSSTALGGLFVSPYRHGWYWWSVWLLSQRLFLSLVTTFVTDVRKRSWIVFIACLAALLFHATHSAHNVHAVRMFDRACMALLVVVAGFNTVETAYSVDGEVPHAVTAPLGSVASAALVVPGLVAVVCAFVPTTIKYALERSSGIDIHVLKANARSTQASEYTGTTRQKSRVNGDGIDGRGGHDDRKVPTASEMRMLQVYQLFETDSRLVDAVTSEPGAITPGPRHDSSIDPSKGTSKETVALLQPSEGGHRAPGINAVGDDNDIVGGASVVVTDNANNQYGNVELLSLLKVEDNPPLIDEPVHVAAMDGSATTDLTDNQPKDSISMENGTQPQHTVDDSYAWC